MQRLASALALLGCILHATLLPWHLSSRLGQQMEAAQLAADLQIICHGDGTGAQADSQPSAPGVPTTACPICKGVIGFQMAILAAAELGLLERPAQALAFSSRGEDGEPTTLIAPRSRGPPVLT